MHDSVSTSPKNTSPDAVRRARCELFAVAATGALQVFFEEVLHLKPAFMAVAGIGWTAYIAHRIRTDSSVRVEWGAIAPRRDDWKTPGLLTLAATIGLVGVGLALGHDLWNPHFLPIVLLYSIWGLIQQFFVQAMIARNLRLVGFTVATTLIVTAVGFGLAHWPDMILMPATAILAFMFCPVYLRRRSLVPLGLFHAWLGALAYFLVLGRDPWVEMIAR